MRQVLQRGATSEHASLDQEGFDHERLPWPGKRMRTGGAKDSSPDAGRQNDLGKLRGALGSLGGGGSALPDGVSSEYSQLLGADLSGVRVHTSGPASDAASSMGARAFTHGANIAFAPGGFDPESAGGRHVLAHELVHVVQNQRSGGAAMEVAARLDVGPSGSPVESEAEAGAASLTSGRSFSVSSRSSLPGISMFGGNEPVPTTAPTPTKTPTTKTPTTTPTTQAAPQQTPAPVATPNATPNAPTTTPTSKTAVPNAPAGSTSATPKGPAKGPTIGPTPQGPTIGPTPKGTPSKTPATPVDLDAKVKETLEARANPAAKAQYGTAINQVNQLKAQSLQYSFAKSGFGNTLFQAFVFPTEAFGEHYGQVYKNNAYRGGSTGDKWQAAIEGLRGVLHMFGDLAGVIAGWAGIAAIVFGLLALITSETIVGGLGFGALAAAADSVATIAALVKIILDVVDMILGLAQIVILCFRIKASKDPVERARFATMLKKESSELAANVTSVAMQALVIVATAGTGTAFAKTAEKSLGKTFGSELAKLTINPIKEVAKDGLKGLTKNFAIESAGKGVATNGRRVLAAEVEEGMVHIQALKRGARGRVTKTREFIKFTSRNQMNGAKLLSVNKQIGKIAAKGGTATIAVSGAEQLKVQTRQPSTSGSGPTEQKGGELNVPSKGAGGSLTTVQMWPSQIEAFTSAKAPLAAAKERMEEQYENAKGQLGEDKSGNVEASLKKILEASKEQQHTGETVKTDAAEGKQNSLKGAETAGKGKEQNAKKESTAGQISGQQSKLDGEGGQLKPPPPKDGVLGWLYNQTVGRIASGIGVVQNWIRNTVSKIAISLSGLTKEELDMAGVENDMRTDATKDDEATASAKEAEAQGAPIQQKVYELQKDKTTDEQAAIQGMADAMQFLEALEEADKTLGEAIESGNHYIENVSPIIRHELETQVGGKAIDAAYIAPITGYADAFIASVGSDDTAATAQGKANEELGSMKAQFSTLNIATGQSQIGKLVQQYETAYGKLAETARGEAGKVKTVIAGFVGTVDYEGVNVNAQAIDKLANDFQHAVDALGDSLYSAINGVLTDYVQQIEAAQASVESTPDEPSDEDKKGGNTPSSTTAPTTTPEVTPGETSTSSSADTTVKPTE